MKAFCTSKISERTKKRLSEYMDISYGGTALPDVFRRKLSEEELIENMQGVDVLIVSYDQITRKVMENCPTLKIIASERDGPEENIDIAAATEMGIPVIHTKGRCLRAVAEHTLLLMLALSRNFVSLVNNERKGIWRTRELTDTITELYGKTLGVIGLGKNGLALAQRASALGMKVIGYDPYADRKILREKGIEMYSLNEVMAYSDVVCPLARATKDTLGLIGREQIEMMKPSAMLVNTGRSSLVDMDALLDALESDKIRAAAIDVYDSEPPDFEGRIFKVEESKLLLTPHVAGNSMERQDVCSEHIELGIIDLMYGKTSQWLFTDKVFASPQFKIRSQGFFGILKGKE